MFAGTFSKNTLPKAIRWLGSELRPKEPTRPEAFPEELWNYTDMEDRLVAEKNCRGYPPVEYAEETTIGAIPKSKADEDSLSYIEPKCDPILKYRQAKVLACRNIGEFCLGE